MCQGKSSEVTGETTKITTSSLYYKLEKNSPHPKVRGV